MAHAPCAAARPLDSSDSRCRARRRGLRESTRLLGPRFHLQPLAVWSSHPDRRRTQRNSRACWSQVPLAGPGDHGLRTTHADRDNPESPSRRTSHPTNRRPALQRARACGSCYRAGDRRGRLSGAAVDDGRVQLGAEQNGETRAVEPQQRDQGAADRPRRLLVVAEWLTLPLEAE